MTKLDHIEPFLELPNAEPLTQSFAVDGIEGDLKQLVTDIFEQELARRLFDANVLGAPHLGTFELVRRNVNADGLVLLPNSSEEEATRYLYRAWRSRDNDGRGVHFLKTYLQMLFPNVCDVEQMMQHKYKPYPMDLYPASTHGGDSDKFLTSRIEITLDWLCEITNFHKLMSVFRSVIPARLTPLFRIRLTILLLIEILIESNLLMQKHINMDYNPCGLRITNKDGIKWTMPRDKEFTKLGLEPYVVGRIIGQTTIKLPFYNSDFDLKVDNNWKIGQKIGGHLSPVPPKLDGSWCLGKKVFPKDYNPDFTPVIRHCKIVSDLLLQKFMEGRVYRPRYLGEFNLKLNGQWQVGGRIVSSAKITANSELYNKPKIDELFQENIRLDYPFTPPKLGGFAQLGTWRKLDSRWKVGEIIERRPFGFQLRKPSIYPDTTADLISAINLDVNGGKFKLPKLETLHGQYLTGFWQIGKASKELLLNGSWKVGGTKWNTDSETVLDSRAMIYALQDVEVVPVDHFNLSYPFKTRLSRSHKLNAWHKLNGGWQLGGSEGLTPFGFTLRGLSVLADTTKSLEKNTLIDVIDRYPALVANKQIDGSWAVVDNPQPIMPLNGSWKVGGRSQSVKTLTILDLRTFIYAPQTVTAIQANHFEVGYSRNIKLARTSKLNAWTRLTDLKISGLSNHVGFGFSMQNHAIPVETEKSLVKNSYGYVNAGKFKLSPIPTLKGQDISDLWQGLTLNGAWKVGACKWLIDAPITLESYAITYAPQIVESSTVEHFSTGLTRLARTGKVNAWTKLDGLLGVQNRTPFGFEIRSDIIISDTQKQLSKESNCYLTGADKFKISPLTLSELWDNNQLKLNGQWRVGAAKWTTGTETLAELKSIIYAPQTIESTTADHFQTGVTRLSRSNKLTTWSKFDNLFNKDSKTPFGFEIRSDITAAEAQKTLEKYVDIDLTGDYFKLNRKVIDGNWQVGTHQNWLKLDGGWAVGGRLAKVETDTLIESNHIAYAIQTVDVTEVNHFDIQYPNRTRLGKSVTLNGWRSLNGQWQVGGAEVSKPFGFALHNNESIPIDSESITHLDKIIDVFDRYTTLNKTATLSGDTKLNGGWKVGGSNQRHKLTINGSWKLGQRSQIVESNALIDIDSVVDVTQIIDSSISISGSGIFKFIDAAGNLQTYTLYTTEKIEIIDNKIALNVKPYGDIFLGVGEITREIIGDVEIVEDHDGVTAIEINGNFYAQFDLNSTDINGLFGVVTYLALQ